MYKTSLLPMVPIKSNLMLRKRTKKYCLLSVNACLLRSADMFSAYKHLLVAAHNYYYIYTSLLKRIQLAPFSPSFVFLYLIKNIQPVFFFKLVTITKKTGLKRVKYIPRLTLNYPLRYKRLHKWFSLWLAQLNFQQLWKRIIFLIRMMLLRRPKTPIFSNYFSITNRILFSYKFWPRRRYKRKKL